MSLRPVSLRTLLSEWPGGVVQSGISGMLAIFGACLAGLLVATWAGWQELGYAVFFMASSLTVYYVRAGSLLPVVVSAPLLFLLACLTASVLMPSLALLSTLAGAAWWLLAGMIVTVVIGLTRGLRSEVLELLADLRRLTSDGSLTLAWRRSRYFRSSLGSWKAIFSLTASTSSTSAKPRAASLPRTPCTSSSGTDAPEVTPTVTASPSQPSSSSPASSMR